MNDIDPKAFLQKGTQNGLSRWRDMNGEYIWKECEILSYDEKTQLFLIHFINSHIKKRVYFSFIEEIIRFFKVNRLNLLLTEENLDAFNQRYKMAIERREKALQIQNIDGYFQFFYKKL